MASQTAASANAASMAGQTLEQTTLNQVFYDSVDAMIVNATELGAFNVVVTTFDGADNQTLVNYYVGLGYSVGLLDVNFVEPLVYNDPFWINWVQYSYGWPGFNAKKALRLNISWR